MVFEVLFESDQQWEAFRALPAVRSALDGAPDPLNGLIIYRGRGGGAGPRKPRKPKPAPSASAMARPEPTEERVLRLTVVTAPESPGSPEAPGAPEPAPPEGTGEVPAGYTADD